MKKIISFFIFSIFLLGFSFANWNLTGVNIISREQWGADDKFLYKGYEEYKDLIKRNQDYVKELKKDKKKYQKYLENIKKRNEREKYLLKHWRKEVQADKVVKYLNGKKLWWNISYKKNKDRIIIHHTASDYNKFKTQKDVIGFLRGIYYFHTIKRGWGDLGYNFIIDPFGNIYEGRKGGENVVGANSKWNNVPSIGIALIGNFEIQEPTTGQKEALVNLLVALSKKYHIDPYKEVYYHKETFKKSPYMKDVKGYSIAGHRDSGYTVCPGKNLYSQLPEIRKEVAERLGKQTKKITQTQKQKILLAAAEKNTVSDVLNLGKKYSFTDKIYIKLTNINNLKNCVSDISNLEVICKDNKITLVRKGILKLKPKEILAYTKDGKKITIKVFPIFFDDIRTICEKKAEKYLKKIGYNDGNENYVKKIQYKVSLAEAKKRMKKQISVLLYDLSFEKFYEIECEENCDIITDIKTFKDVKKFKVDKLKDSVVLWIGDKFYGVRYLEINQKDPSKNIIITNFKRKSYAGIPWNSFKGSLIIKKDKVKIIGGNIEDMYILINKLPMKDYLKGVAESNDQVPYEYTKTMALLAKTYALFYINGKNKNPNIPEGVSYNAIDDPRTFQKYVGSGFEKTSKKRIQALKDTENTYVLYDGYVPILPYFSCSIGFTISAKLKFHRLDTPYIQSMYDPKKCEKFYGHGVGLSGAGAKYLAERGLKMKHILLWYFSGIKIVKE